jgi:hypothetical protein
MNEIEQFTRGLIPIIQGILGSAIFALILLFGRILYRLLTDLNKNYKYRLRYNEVIKIVFHKKYLNSNGLYYFTRLFISHLKGIRKPFERSYLLIDCP